MEETMSQMYYYVLVFILFEKNGKLFLQFNFSRLHKTRTKPWIKKKSETLFSPYMGFIYKLARAQMCICIFVEDILDQKSFWLKKRFLFTFRSDTFILYSLINIK